MDYQTIYFATNQVMYQMFAKYSRAGTERAEEIIDIIAGN